MSQMAPSLPYIYMTVSHNTDSLPLPTNSDQHQSKSTAPSTKDNHIRTMPSRRNPSPDRRHSNGSKRHSTSPTGNFFNVGWTDDWKFKGAAVAHGPLNIQYKPKSDGLQIGYNPYTRGGSISSAGTSVSDVRPHNNNRSRDDLGIDSHSVTSSRRESSSSARSHGQGDASSHVNRVDTGSSTKSHGHRTSRGHVYPAAVYGFYRNRDGERESIGDKIIKLEDKAMNWLNGGPFEAPGNSGPSRRR